jgi:hypothetical protein
MGQSIIMFEMLKHKLSFLGLSPRTKLSDNSGITPNKLSQSKTPGKYAKVPLQKGKTPNKTPSKQSGPDRSELKINTHDFYTPTSKMWTHILLYHCCLSFLLSLQLLNPVRYFDETWYKEKS